MGLFDRAVVSSLPLVPRPVVGRVASRYVAGETLAEAVDAVRRLNGRGAMATLDVLGEEVAERATARAAVDEYLRVLAAIEREGLDCNVSIKLTLLGLKIDRGFCRDNVAEIAESAARRGNFVRIDMEDRTTTDDTLAIYRELQARTGNLGVVLQAYMRRTLADVDRLPAQTANVRLCKGIYVEPRAVAWKGYETVRHNFVAALEKLVARGAYVAVATHDEYLVCAARALLDRHRVPRERYEFQMLLGVEEELGRILIDEGHRLRVYVPYGRDWYAYSVRRLRENPEIAGHVMRATLGMTPRAGGRPR
ncbi:MAG TPA: proline dehydrogenase family protein [Thermoanaerobaculia bacterium]|nr:proline dehydrogenase family protein [Thermoanaerobaculia bacterium]